MRKIKKLLSEIFERISQLRYTYKDTKETKRISWCRVCLHNEQHPSKLMWQYGTISGHLEVCLKMGATPQLSQFPWMILTFPSESSAMTVGLFSDKPAETTSQNQSWSSALDPFRRTSWVRSCGHIGSEKEGRLGHPKPTDVRTHRERERKRERERV